MNKTRNIGRIERKLSRWGVVFVAPSIIFFSIFSFYPIITALYISLFKKNLLSLKKPDFIGLGNYLYLMKSTDFWNSVKATAIFTMGTFLPLLILSLVLALFIMNVNKGKRFFQMSFYTPAVITSVVSAAIWLLIFDPRGLGNQWVNTIMNTPGVDHRWLSNLLNVRIATMVVYFWKYLGNFIIIFIAGLASIPPSLYEAARIDGSTGWKTFWYITVPLLKPTIFLVSTMSMLQCLKTFSTQYLFTQAGAPQAPINVITLNIYNTGIRDFKIGRASAMSIVLFIIMLFFTWVQFKTSKSDEVSY